MKSIVALVGFLLALVITGYSQNKNAKVVSDDYSRNALTVIFLNYNQYPYAEFLNNSWPKLVIDDKWDNNQVKNITLKAPYDLRPAKIEQDFEGMKQALRSKAEFIDKMKKAENPEYVSPYKSIYKIPNEKRQNYQQLKALEEKQKNEVQNELITEKYPHQIIQKWFNMQQDGTVDLEAIFKRGLYNATDADYHAAMDSKIKDALLKDAGLKLINNSYIVVFDFGKILSIDEQNAIIKNALNEFEKLRNDYNSAEHQEIIATLDANIKNLQENIRKDENGFIAEIKIFLYKLDFNETVAQSLWDLFEEIPDNNSKWKINNATLNNISFPLLMTSILNFPFAESVQYNKGHSLAPEKQASKEELFDMLVRSQFEGAKMMFTRKVDAFKVRAPVFEANKKMFFPQVKAKIGKKESIRLDKRFFVWEKQEGSDGNAKSKRKGVVRASNVIVDNRQSTTGNTGLTTFYQVAGKKLEEGMVLQERPDFGMGLVFLSGFPMSPVAYNSTTNYDSPMLFGGRLDANISPLFGMAGVKFLSEFRFFIEVKAIGEVSDTIFNSPDALNSDDDSKLKSNAAIGFGFSKDIHLMKNIKISPFAQYSIASWDNIDFAGQVGLGVRLPINIIYPLSIVPGCTYYTKYENENLSTYTQLSGFYFDASLRIEF